MSSGILAGMRVIEGSAFVAAPLGGMTLAQLGADVIRFDPLGGGLDYHRWPVTAGGKSLFWAGMNKGKRSIEIDINHPEGRDIISRLIAGTTTDTAADTTINTATHSKNTDGIFLTNFPQRGWFAYDKLVQRRSDLIYVNILGDRHGGSAVDYTVNCAVGFALTTGDPASDEPCNHLLPAWDNIAGQMAVVALLAADRHRHLKGEGQLVTLALKDVAVATTSNLGNLAEVAINDEDRQKTGNYLYGAFGRDLVSKDGVRVMLVGLTPKQWQGMTQAMQIEVPIQALEKKLGLDLAKEGNRFKARQEIAQVIEPWFAAHDYALICQHFDEHGVCYGPYRSFRELLEQDEDCSAANPMMAQVHQPEIGDYLASGSPIRFQHNLSAMPAPRLGEHTTEILKDELGFTDAELGSLIQQQVLAQDLAD